MNRFVAFPADTSQGRSLQQQAFDSRFLQTLETNSIRLEAFGTAARMTAGWGLHHICSLITALLMHVTIKVCCWCRNYEDAYTDPGSPATRRTEIGTYVLAMLDGQKKLLMQGTHSLVRPNLCPE